MERIRVLRVIARMNVGGPAVQISGLMRGLDPLRFDQRLVTGYCGDGEVDFLESQASDVRAIRINGLGRAVKPWDDLRAVSSIRGLISSFQPHIVHTHTAKAGVVGRIATRMSPKNIKNVHTYHGHLLHGYFSPAKTRAVIGVERFLAARTDALVSVGAQVRDDLLAAHIGRPDQFTVIPPGLVLPVSPAERSLRDELGFAQNTVVVGFVGRLTMIKRPDRFLDVVRLTQRDHPEVRFVVAGDGSEAQSMRAAIEAESLPVTMLGWRSDIDRVLKACDVLVLTSDNEGTPLSLIQAGMAGLPVVATHVGSVAEVVADGKTGLVVSPEPQLISRALAELLEDSDKRFALGRAAQLWTTQRYGLDRLVGDHAALYMRLMSG